MGTATLKLLLQVLIFYIVTKVEGLPNPNQGSELKLQFFGQNYDPNPDISQSNFRENAYAYVKPGHSSGDVIKNRHDTAVLTRFDASGVTSNKSCELEYKAVGQSSIFSAVTMVYSLHGDKIVIAYASGNLHAKSPPSDIHHHFRIVHMDTCAIYEVKFETDFIDAIFFSKVDIFHRKDGTFEVFVPASPCEGARCKYTFNDKAELQSGPVAFLPVEYKKSLLKIFPSTVSADNYFVFISDWKVPENGEIYSTDINSEFVSSQKLVYVKDGHVKELARFHYDHRKEMLLVKNSDGFLSACRRYESNDQNEINCIQFNEDVMKFNVTTAVNKDEELFALHNLPSGDILLVKSMCGHPSHENCKSISLEKWSHNSQVQKLHSITDFEHRASSKHGIVSVEKDNLVCLSAYYYEYKDHYDFSKKCFTKNVLSLDH